MSAEDVGKHDKVLERFQRHFDKSLKNTIYERVKFNRRVQQEGETVDEFITDIFRLVENCKFGDLQVRDRIVVELRDSELSEKLQLTSDYF